jgi:hypothetical protein
MEKEKKGCGCGSKTNATRMAQKKLNILNIKKSIDKVYKTRTNLFN